MDIDDSSGMHIKAASGIQPKSETLNFSVQ